MQHKIRFYFILVTVLSVLVSTAVGVYLSYNTLLKQTRATLQTEALLLGSVNYLEGRRITRIAADGTVLYDSETDSNTMDNHRSREEFIEAMDSGEGFAVRKSETVNQATLYYATVLKDGSVLRLAVQIDSVWTVLKDSLPSAVLIMCLLILAVSLVTSALTKRIVHPMEESLANSDTEHLSIQAAVYPELVPFLTLVENKNIRIREMLDDLRKRQEEMALITSNMNEGMLFIDARGLVQFANPAAFALFGANSYNCNGRSYIYFSNHKKLAKAVKKAEKGKKYAKDINQGNKTLLLSATPVYGHSGYGGVICIFWDVTEQRQAEKARRDFTANVSHELKTPLTAIMGYSELIAGGIESKDEITKFANIIQKESQHLLTLINGILRLSKLDEGDSVTQEEVDVMQLLQECAQSLEIAAAKRNINITVEGGPCKVLSDKEMLKHLLLNVMDNAVRYNVENGSVRVKLWPDENTVIIEDTGIGISDDDQQRIFERFYRADKSRSKESGGSGLGMAIVKHIAEKLDAAITLASELNKGTTVTIKL